MGLYTFFWIAVIVVLFIVGSKLGKNSSLFLYVCWGVAFGYLFRLGFLTFGMDNMLDFTPFNWMR